MIKNPQRSPYVISCDIEQHPLPYSELFIRGKTNKIERNQLELSRKMCHDNTISKSFESDSPSHTGKITVISAYAVDFLVGLVSVIVFAILDLLDFVLCLVYRWADYLLEKEWTPCYCCIDGAKLEGLSETLYFRKNWVRSMVSGMKKKKNVKKDKVWPNEDSETQTPCVKISAKLKHLGSRWSDCGCHRCVSWNSPEKLYVAVGGAQGSHSCASVSNVIFIHGFLSSSSFWTETIYPVFSDATKSNYRFYAVDLLGFGKSPKPFNCFYTVAEHMDMIERSVLQPYNVKSFHLVAHSMGCIVALALATKYQNALKSITLLSPPYFPAPSGEKASQFMIKNVAPKKIWPLLTFGSSVMSWYEHVGRTVCLIVCKSHRFWEWILKQIAKNRVPDHQIEDITRHTHYSAWHNFHNVICGTAQEMDRYLEIVRKSDCKMMILHGKQDKLVPLVCSLAIKLKVGKLKLKVLDHANHSTVILGRERAFARELEELWDYCG